MQARQEFSSAYAEHAAARALPSQDQYMAARAATNNGREAAAGQRAQFVANSILETIRAGRRRRARGLTGDIVWSEPADEAAPN